MSISLPFLLVAQGLVVHTPTPDALCPDLASTRQMVAARLGEVAGAGYRASYSIVRHHGEPPQEAVKLELEGPDGELRLTRELPVSGSCSAMADAIALVLERYFRSLVNEEASEVTGAETDPTEDPPASGDGEPVADGEGQDGPRAPGGGRVRAGLVAAPTAEAPLDSGTDDAGVPEVPAAWLSVGVGAHSHGAGMAVVPRLELRLTGDWVLATSVALGLGAREEQVAPAALASSTGLDTRLALAWGPKQGRLRPFVGLGLMAFGERGTSELSSTAQTRYRFTFGPSLEAGWSVLLGESWFVNVVGGVAFPAVTTGRFMIDTQEVLVPKEQAFAGLGIGRALLF